VSATGIAFYARGEYKIGRKLAVVLTHDGRAYAGHGTIQSIRRTKLKMMRYGLHCTDFGTDKLAKSLASINFAIQAEQRRRVVHTK
jgi:hypothetical protein